MEPSTVERDIRGNLYEENSLDANNNNNLNGSSTYNDYQDFPLDDEEEYKEDYFDSEGSNTNNNTNNSNNVAWVQLLNLPSPSNHHHQAATSTGVPVGGMRRVSSCYFSIASNMSNNNDYHTVDNNNNSYGSQQQQQQSHYDALSFDGRNTSDFLLHDVLMNVFSFLDAQSLASFSETGRRPNFECFYFLELQLQRALLMGDSHHFGSVGNNIDGKNEMLLGRVDEGVVENDEFENDMIMRMRLDDINNILLPQQDELDEAEDRDDNKNINQDSNNTIPSFEGSIAGTGVISRLASLKSSSARKIVQTYLDSNTSMHGMPLSHSLAYFRQVLLRQHPSSFPHRPTNMPADNMAKNARNMALFVTFLGAAYMHTQQQGGGIIDVTIPMPDPSEVMNEENMEALKNMMLKVGLAGGFFKAGKTMKEKAKQANAVAVSSVNDNDNSHVGDGEDEVGQGYNNCVHGEGSGRHDHSTTNAHSNATMAVNHASDTDLANGGTSSSGQAQRPASPQQRSVSIGSLEDLSHMISHPSNIATRLYNAFSINNAGSTANLDPELNKDCNGSTSGVPSSSMHSSDEKNIFSLPKRRHRSKRSHKTIRHDEGSEFNYYDVANPEENKSSEPEVMEEEARAYSPLIDEEQKTGETHPSHEAMAYAMDHPFSPNPYDHPSSSTLNTTAAAAIDSNQNSSKGGTEAATSFFSFSNMKQESMSPQEMPDNNENHVPTGCIGAYAHAVTTAASEVTHLIKEERKANFESLPPTTQLELGVRFIDACTSDNKLHIVKEILQKQKMMDVDKFFIGPDDTETCALHAAAFNGAEKVLQFLCGGIDECDPNEDCGLCDVNVKDANGWTALHFAAGANSVTSVRVLADHGAKLTIEASNGYTPYHWAERLSNEEVASELERLGADNRFVGRWMFGGGETSSSPGSSTGDDRRIPFVSFLANRFFAFSR
mmetsp:Transcript_31734/g.66753  ORF Transcript_31734/g.66753 Transcript_31734/m.66753 type:complete len:946 (-) Transcript_31734:48-2885(-)